VLNDNNLNGEPYEQPIPTPEQANPT
jgi:hypothetical protein